MRYTFRSKKKPWGLYYYYYYLTEKGLERREAIGPYGDDPYYRAFLSGKYYRKSCYSCRFACPERAGDITVGDYWGIEKAHPDFYDEKGVSLVLLNTPAGLNFFDEECSGSCDWLDSDFESACAENVNLLRPSHRTPEDEKEAVALQDAIKAGDANLVFGRLLRQHGVKGFLKGILPGGMIDFARLLRRKTVG